MKTRDDTPKEPLPPHRRGKVARIAIKKIPAPKREVVHEQVRTGALLDPFGQDD
ncbi:MAG: hypothetical protein LC659_12650 [Myxococcales bacterium]|nr:hypothetical protein [Myxococcales bacterium]